MSASKSTERFRGVRRVARASAFVLGAMAIASPMAARASLSAAVRPAEKMIAESRLDEAKKLLETEARRGNIFAYFELAKLHESGTGFAKSEQTAFALYKKAGLPNPIRAKHKAGVPEAQFKVAEMYRQGIGTKADAKTALRWYRWAADGGHEGAQLALAEAHLTGRGTAKNPQDALFWASLAQRRGATDARVPEWLASARQGLSDQQLALVDRRLAAWELADD